MTKTQLIKSMREGFGITAKEAEARLGYVDDIMLLVAEGEVSTKENPNKTKIGTYLTVEKVHKDRKEGIMKTADDERPYVVEAHEELRIKATPKAKLV